MTDKALITRGDEIGVVLATDLSFRVKIEAIEAFFQTLPQEFSEPVHRFAPGLYCRELFMPKGIFWVSRVHKKEHIAIISKGDVSVYSEAGVERLTAPHTMITKPGTKRLILTHEDTIWTTIHATELTEADGIETIENAMTCNTLKEYDAQAKGESCLTLL